MLHGQRQIPVMFVAFDLLAQDDESLLALPGRERGQRLEALQLDGPHGTTTIAIPYRDEPGGTTGCSWSTRRACVEKA